MSYFDNNATTPIHPLALDVLTQSYEDDWSNPSSPYRQSSRTKAKLNKARFEWAQLFGSKEGDVIFTSGATEANNMVIASAARNHSDQARILISGIEHPSISIPAKHCFQDRVDVLAMEPRGLVCLASLQEKFERGLLPVLVCVMAANNETGVVQPWCEVARICEQYQVPFHCDATQWVGKMPIFALHQAFSFTASAHKFGGPKGVGWLVDKGESSWQVGGNQEGGKRAGTENFPAIASMIKAWHECDTLLQEVKAEDRAPWRNNMEEKVCSHVPGTQVIGQGMQRLWNTSLLLMPKFDNLRWIAKLDALGFEVSTGSACSTGSDEPSSTAQAFSLAPQEFKRLVRISSYLSHTQADWNNLGDALIQAYHQLLEDAKDSNVISI